jgi:hypothetical protein
LLYPSFVSELFQFHSSLLREIDRIVEEMRATTAKMTVMSFLNSLLSSLS